MQHRLQQQAANLENEGWEGAGSQAFFKEMKDAILPALQRLTQGLESGELTSQEITSLFREAEKAARKPMTSDVARSGDGNVARFAAYGPPGGGASLPGAKRTPPKNRSLQYTTRNPNSVFSEAYLEQFWKRKVKIAGSNSKALNSVMEKLLESPSPADRDRFLIIIAEARNRTLGEIRADYNRFLEIQRTQRRSPEKLDYKSQWLDFTDYPDFLGSTPSLQYGKVVGDVFGIDPVFGALLNPTGGIMGAGNSRLPQPGHNTPLSYHTVFHDAAGYLRKTHGLGPGYDYLRKEKGSNPTDELAGQISGMRYWHKRMDSPGPDWIVEPTAEQLMEDHIYRQRNPPRADYPYYPHWNR
jgi:hypothetical protein